MPNFLSTKTAGLPRYVWVALIGGAVMVGLYLRSKSQATGTTPADDAQEPTGTEATYDPSMVGVGGPLTGSVVPVSSPTIPEGFAESFSALIGTLGTVATGSQDVAIAAINRDPNAVPAAQGADSTGAAAAVAPRPSPTGGGAPRVSTTAHAPVGGLPSEAGKTWAEQIKWLSTHPAWYASHPQWIGSHPVAVSAARALPGERIPG